MTLRELEAASIRAFVQSCSEHFTGRDVLDYGAGKSPYRDIVEAAGGRYLAFDHPLFPGNVSEEVYDDAAGENDFDTVLCTQVIQYVSGSPSIPGFYEGVYDEATFLAGIAAELKPNGVLVLTFPTNWPEVDPEDLHRFTASGMKRLLTEAGFTVERMERRAEIANRSDVFALGYGAVARA